MTSSFFIPKKKIYISKAFQNILIKNDFIIKNVKILHLASKCDVTFFDNIKYITKKNGDLMIPWRDAHPQCMNLQHPLNDTYLGIMNQAMGGKGEFFDSESKIIRKISKSVTIDKSDF